MARFGRLLVAVSLITYAACTGGSGTNASAPDANPDLRIDASVTDELALTCTADQSAFPIFSRSCLDSTDCAIATHQFDCCGTLATGISEADLPSFEQAESACRPLFPDCGCASQPPVLDDGTMASSLESIGVGCSAEGFCVTFNLEQPGS